MVICGTTVPTPHSGICLFFHLFAGGIFCEIKSALSIVNVCRFLQAHIFIIWAGGLMRSRDCKISGNPKATMWVKTHHVIRKERKGWLECSQRCNWRSLNPFHWATAFFRSPPHWQNSETPDVAAHWLEENLVSTAIRKLIRQKTWTHVTEHMKSKRQWRKTTYNRNH